MCNRFLLPTVAVLALCFLAQSALASGGVSVEDIYSEMKSRSLSVDEMISQMNSPQSLGAQSQAAQPLSDAADIEQIRQSLQSGSISIDEYLLLMSLDQNRVRADGVSNIGYTETYSTEEMVKGIIRKNQMGA
jgi:hypothetical protein